MEQRITDAYIAYVQEHGESPKTVFAFAQLLGIDENEFYRHFSSFKAVENNAMHQVFNQTLGQLESDEVYNNYGPREKILAFYFAWIEKARQYRSFLQYLHNRQKIYLGVPGYLEPIKEPFLRYMRKLVNEAVNTGEMAQRRLLTNRYADGLWLELAFIHQFWLNDSSTDFEKTDTAIEKSVKLAFELMGSTVMDAAFDFGKFLFQNRKFRF